MIKWEDLEEDEVYLVEDCDGDDVIVFAGNEEMICIDEEGSIAYQGTDEGGLGIVKT